MSSGDAFTFKGQSQGKAFYAEPMDKDALVKEIEAMADDNVSAAVTDLGVSVTLEDIHFVPDEPVIRILFSILSPTIYFINIFKTPIQQFAAFTKS